MSKFNIALVGGTGAIGQTIAAKLQSSLNQSSDPNKPKLFIVGRKGSKSLEELHDKSSITLIEINPDQTQSITITPLNRDQIVDSLHAVPNDVPKFPIFMTKGGKPMDEAVATMLEDAKQGGQYLGAAILQNGIGNAEKILATNLISRNDLMYSTLSLASSLSESGELKQENPAYKIIVGNLAGILSPILETIFNLLKSSGLRIEKSLDIEKKVWIKLMWNAAFNGVAAIKQQNIGEIYQDQESLNLIKELMQEVRAVASAKGIIIEDRGLNSQDSLNSFKPSTLQDLEAGKPLEIDPIWQAIVDEANKYNIKVPKIQELLEQLRVIDARLKS